MSDAPHDPEHGTDPVTAPASSWPHRPPPAPPLEQPWSAPPSHPAPPAEFRPPPPIEPPPPVWGGPPPEWDAASAHLPSGERRAWRDVEPWPDPTARTLVGAGLALVAGIALVVAVFLPWVVAGSATVDGWHAAGDARFLFAIGILSLFAGVALVAAVPVRWLRLAVLVAAVAVVAIAATDAVDAGRAATMGRATVRAGAGPWLALAAGVVLALSAGMLGRRGHERPARPTSV